MEMYKPPKWTIRQKIVVVPILVLVLLEAFAEWVSRWCAAQEIKIADWGGEVAGVEEEGKDE